MADSIAVFYIMDAGCVPAGGADAWRSAMGLAASDTLSVECDESRSLVRGHSFADKVINKVATALRTGKVVVLGHGYGGSVAVEVAKYFDKKSETDFDLPDKLTFATFGTKDWPSPGKIKHLDIVHYMFRHDSALDGMGNWSIRTAPSFQTTSYHDDKTRVCWLTSDVADIKSAPKGTKDKIHAQYGPYIAAHASKRGDSLTPQEIDAVHAKNVLTGVLSAKRAELHVDGATGAISPDPTVGRDEQRKQFGQDLVATLAKLEGDASNAPVTPLEHLQWWNLCAFRRVYIELGGKVDARMNLRIMEVYRRLKRRKGVAVFNFAAPGNHPAEMKAMLESVSRPAQSGGGRATYAAQAALLLVTVVASMVPR